MIRLSIAHTEYSLYLWRSSTERKRENYNAQCKSIRKSCSIHVIGCRKLCIFVSFCFVFFLVKCECESSNCCVRLAGGVKGGNVLKQNKCQIKCENMCF